MSTPDRPVDPPTDPTMPPPPPYPTGEPTAYPTAGPASGQIPAPQTGPVSTPPLFGGAPASDALTPQAEKQVGALAHAVGAGAYVLSAGTLGFVAALVMYIVFRDRGPFVRANLANALNVQIMTGIVTVIAWLLIVTLLGAIVGVPLLLAAGAYCVVVHIIGAVKALNGEWWKPPFTPDFVK